VIRVRGKNKIITTMAALFIASLAISSFQIAKVYAVPAVFIDPFESGGPGMHIGSSFRIDVWVGDPDRPDFQVFGVKGCELILQWNQKVLKLPATYPDDTVELGEMLEGPFLQKIGRETYPVAKKGIAGESLVFTDLITMPKTDVQDGYGILASVDFEVIGGGQTDISLNARLFNINFDDIFCTSWGGHYWGPDPFISFTWWVPTGRNATEMNVINATGTKYYTTVDEAGDLDFHDTPPYWQMRPVLNLDDAGVPDIVEEVEGGTMFYGDEIIFDASGSYDLKPDENDPRGYSEEELDPTAFNWVIRNGGVDSFVYRGSLYDTRYESGVELPAINKFSYVFPGSGSVARNYAIYSRMLGFHDLTLTVTDSDGNVAKFYTWIRIYRMIPAKLVMMNIPDPKLNAGDTLTIGWKVQNRGGTSWFPWDSLSVYLELARMTHAAGWFRMRFDISKAGVTKYTIFSDAIWLGATETPVDAYRTYWTLPSNLGTGKFKVTGTAWFCASGYTFGMKATGTETAYFEVS